VVLAALLMSLIAAAAGGFALTRSPAACGQAVVEHANGTIETDGRCLKIVYKGRLITRDELEELQQQGKALATASDVASARRGVEHAFDTEAELDAWAEKYVIGPARQRMLSAE